jgi:hypothetical protein
MVLPPALTLATAAGTFLGAFGVAVWITAVLWGASGRAADQIWLFYLSRQAAKKPTDSALVERRLRVSRRTVNRDGRMADMRATGTKFMSVGLLTLIVLSFHGTGWPGVPVMLLALSAVIKIFTESYFTLGALALLAYIGSKSKDGLPDVVKTVFEAGHRAEVLNQKRKEQVRTEDDEDDNDPPVPPTPTSAIEPQAPRPVTERNHNQNHTRLSPKDYGEITDRVISLISTHLLEFSSGLTIQPYVKFQDESGRKLYFDAALIDSSGELRSVVEVKIAPDTTLTSSLMRISQERMLIRKNIKTLFVLVIDSNTLNVASNRFTEIVTNLRKLDATLGVVTIENRNGTLSTFDMDDLVIAANLYNKDLSGAMTVEQYNLAAMEALKRRLAKLTGGNKKN